MDENPLKPWLMDMLNYGRIKNEGFLDPDIVKNLVQEHIDGRKDNSSKLWNILMWQTWLDNWY